MRPPLTVCKQEACALSTFPTRWAQHSAGRESVSQQRGQREGSRCFWAVRK